MRSITSTARLSHDDIHDRPAIGSICEAIQKIRPIEAWLTSQDVRRLREHHCRCERIGSGVYPLLGDLIRAKLTDAVRTGADELGPDVATGYSRVTYALNGRAPQSAVLFHWGYPETGEFGLSVCTLLGATLLGMKAGQRAPFPRAVGTAGTVELLEVPCQPEAQRRLLGGVAT